MSYLINNQQKLTEIIFENRNKNYGAYVLRSSYGETMLKSLSCIIFGFGSIISIAWYYSNRPLPAGDVTGQVVIEKIYTIPVDLEEIKKPEETAKPRATPSEPAGKPNTTASSNVVTSDTNQTDVSVPLNNAVVTNSVSSDIPGGTGNDDVADEGKKKSGGGEGSSGVKGNFEVDSQPEFEGGLAALYRFVSSRLKYPGRAFDEGIEGVVYVKFVVDEKGKVGNLSVLNNLGYGLEDEAKRVVAMIPNFKTPAKVNGEAVKVYYQLPIKFKYAR